ncbi:MAG: hypothetical protein ACRYFX_04640 [Janthinobacterium lividum]
MTFTAIKKQAATLTQGLKDVKPGSPEYAQLAARYQLVQATLGSLRLTIATLKFQP